MFMEAQCWARYGLWASPEPSPAAARDERRRSPVGEGCDGVAAQGRGSGARRCRLCARLGRVWCACEGSRVGRACSKGSGARRGRLCANPCRVRCLGDGRGGVGACDRLVVGALRRAGSATRRLGSWARRGRLVARPMSDDEGGRWVLCVVGSGVVASAAAAVDELRHPRRRRLSSSAAATLIAKADTSAAGSMPYFVRVASPHWASTAVVSRTYTKCTNPSH